jgi:hypothetical protein
LADVAGQLLVERDEIANQLRRFPVHAPLTPVGGMTHSRASGESACAALS